MRYLTIRIVLGFSLATAPEAYAQISRSESIENCVDQMRKSGYAEDYLQTMAVREYCACSNDMIERSFSQAEKQMIVDYNNGLRPSLPPVLAAKYQFYRNRITQTCCRRSGASNLPVCR
jgi:hypothetical protein